MDTEKMKQVVFLVVVAIIAAALLIGLFAMDFIIANAPIILGIIFIIVLLIILLNFGLIIFLKDYERAVIFRFGKVNRVGGPGWAIMIPVLESFTKVDTRVHTIDVTKQDVITKDGIEVRADAVIYIRVKRDKQSVINSVIEVENYEKASLLYVVALIRDIAGSLELNELISNIDALNKRLTDGLDKISVNWGVDCETVEIKDIQIPRLVLDAMHEEKAAVQQKLARMESAKAHQAEIDAVKEAAENLSDRALAYYYVKALEKLGEGQSTKFIFPMELTKLASAVSGGGSKSEDLEELFRKYAPAIKKIVGAAAKKKK
ncbi:MAG: SPFH domain-containing protein [Candidatus Diapherotrites archaeon]